MTAYAWTIEQHWAPRVRCRLADYAAAYTAARPADRPAISEQARRDLQHLVDLAGRRSV